MKTTKKLMALLLSVIMIVTFMPAMALTAFADEIQPRTFKVEYNNYEYHDDETDQAVIPGIVKYGLNSVDNWDTAEIASPGESKTYRTNDKLIFKLKSPDVYKDFGPVVELEEKWGNAEDEIAFYSTNAESDEERIIIDNENCFSFTPKKDGEVNVRVWWSSGEHDYDCIGADEEREELQVETNVNGRGQIVLDKTALKANELFSKSKYVYPKNTSVVATFTADPDNSLTRVLVDYGKGDSKNKEYFSEPDSGQANISDILSDGKYSIALESRSVYIEADFTDDDIKDPIVEGKYEAKLLIGDNDSNISINPGESVDLTATLLCNGVEVADGVTYTLYTTENEVFDGDEPIMNVLSKTANTWNCTSLVVTGDDDTCLDGNASFKIRARYKGCDFWDDISIEVENRVNYHNRQIKSNDGGKFVDVQIENVSGRGLLIDPYYNSGNYTFTFETGYYENDEWNKVEKGETSNNVLALSVSDLKQLIIGHDPSFVVKVYAQAAGGTKYKCDEVTVNVYKEGYSIFDDCYIDFPSSIPYDPNTTVYDYVKQAKLISKSTGEVKENRENSFEWRFVNEDPDKLGTKELGDAASILANKVTGERPDQIYFDDYSNPTDPDVYGLKLDHLGSYWIVAAGAQQYGDLEGEYRGFIIERFELTDAAIYYDKKPEAKVDSVYSENPDPLVTAGELGGADANSAKIQYKIDSKTQTGTWKDEINDIKASVPGEYTVSYRVVDKNDESKVIIPAELVTVNVNKQPVYIELNDVVKTYGTMDPSFDFEDIVKNKNAVPPALQSEIKFTRERGENVNENGYRIYALSESALYDPIVSDGVLTIKPAKYHVSSVDKISVNSLDEFKVSYTSDKEKIEVLTQGNTKFTKAEAANGTLTLRALEPTSETITLVADDDNHERAEWHIDVVVTSSSFDNTNGTAAAVDASVIPEDAANLSVGTCTAEGEVEISFTDGEGKDVGFSSEDKDKTIVVKIKYDEKMGISLQILPLRQDLRMMMARSKRRMLGSKKSTE